VSISVADGCGSFKAVRSGIAMRRIAAARTGETAGSSGDIRGMVDRGSWKGFVTQLSLTNPARRLLFHVEDLPSHQPDLRLSLMGNDTKEIEGTQREIERIGCATARLNTREDLVHPPMEAIGRDQQPT